MVVSPAACCRPLRCSWFRTDVSLKLAALAWGVELCRVPPTT